MRVNMDSSIVSDSRFKLLAKDLGVSVREVYGACYLAWLCCYDRLAEDLPAEEIDVAADVDGFAMALVRRKLADNLGDGMVRIHGVRVRIDFLLKQKAKGAKGGKKKAEAKAKAKAVADAVADATAQATADALDPALAYSHDQDHALAQDHNTEHERSGCITNGGDLEVVVASLGFAVNVSPKDRARAKRIADAGAITAEEISDAAEVTRRAAAKNRVAYFLGVIEGRRKEAADEAAKPTPPGPRSQSPPVRLVAPYERDLAMSGVIGGLGEPRPDEVERCRRLGVKPSDVEDNMEHRSWPSWLDAREAVDGRAQTTA